jgi:hypothetical protein
MRALLIPLCALALAGCQTTLSTSEEVATAGPPPYPPGYAPAGPRLPDVVEAALPEGVVPAQVLISDSGCYYYYEGALTKPLRSAELGRLCVQQDAPVGVPVDLSGVSLGRPPAS